MEEMNVFLRSHKILQSESHLVAEQGKQYWCFCIRYIEDLKLQEKIEASQKVDYKEILDEDSFKRYVKLRDIRREVASKEAVPAYVIFTNKELAEIAKIKTLTLSSIKSIKGIGDKKVEKYGEAFVNSSETGGL